MNRSSSRWPLAAGESLRWEGRPAPRCYVFRHWLQALIGLVLFLACSFWLMVGVQLVREKGYSPWLLLVPILLVVVAFLIGPGQLLLSRWRWEKIFYGLTEGRLLVQSGFFRVRTTAYPLAELKGYQQKTYGKKQVSFRLSFHGRRPVVLECLEHADLLRDLLPDDCGRDGS